MQKLIFVSDFMAYIFNVVLNIQKLLLKIQKDYSLRYKNIMYNCFSDDIHHQFFASNVPDVIFNWKIRIFCWHMFSQNGIVCLVTYFESS